MKYRTIGGTEMNASVMTLGAWAIGGGTWWKTTEEEASIRTIHEALDYGINIIDTAPVYGFGHSEEMVGKALVGRRHEVLISTKCGLWWDDEQGSYHFEKDGHTVRRNLSRNAIKLGVEQSLKRLGTDYIDILYTHQQACPPFNTPIEETAEALKELVKEGKIRAVGASNIEPHHIDDYRKYGILDIVQMKYSMLDRKVEKEILPLCNDKNITFHAYSPLEQGLLTGKINKGYVLMEGDARADKKWWQPNRIDCAIDFVNSLKPLCDKYQCNQTYLSIAWILAQGDNINIICGARKPEQIIENIKACELTLEPEDILVIRKKLEGLEYLE